MDDPSVDVHDTLIELLRTMDLRPLVELLGALAGLDLRELDRIVDRTPTIAVPSLTRPRKRVGDLVLIVYDRNELEIAILVLEMQLSWDPGKRWVWGLLAAAFAADLQVEARVAVLSPNPKLREKIRRRLVPDIQPRPLVIEPEQIPLICDLEQARRRPRETIFAALYHVAETSESVESRVAGIRAALIANQSLDPQDQLRYGALMSAMTPAEILQWASDLLPDKDLEQDPDPNDLPEFLREGFLFVTGKNEGKAEGIELGRSEGRSESLHALRNVLIDILAARGITLEDSVRARIEQCRDVATLARWCTRASSFTEGSLDEQLV
jgi:hypothetical protein